MLRLATSNGGGLKFIHATEEEATIFTFTTREDPHATYAKRCPVRSYHVVEHYPWWSWEYPSVANIKSQHLFRSF